MMRFVSALTAAAALAGAAPATQASVISVNFEDNNAANDALAAADVAGVVPAAGWIAGPTGNHLLALTDNAGGATGATLSYNFGSAWYINSGTGSTPDGKMMAGWFDFGGDAYEGGSGFSLTVSNLPDEFIGPGYQVYVYFDSDGDDARVGRFSIGDQRRYIKNTGSGSDFPAAGGAASYVLSTATTLADAQAGASAHYAVFNVSTAAEFTLKVDDGKWKGGINGLQIVAVPEPSTLMLAAAAAMTLLCRSRPSME